MVAEPIQLPVYVVTGTNWTIEVPLAEFNAERTEEHGEAGDAVDASVMAVRDEGGALNLFSNADANDRGNLVPDEAHH